MSNTEFVRLYNGMKVRINDKYPIDQTPTPLDLERVGQCGYVNGTEHIYVWVHFDNGTEIMCLPAELELISEREKIIPLPLPG